MACATHDDDVDGKGKPPPRPSFLLPLVTKFGSSTLSMMALVAVLLVTTLLDNQDKRGEKERDGEKERKEEGGKEKRGEAYDRNIALFLCC